jgi:cytochrome c nitrite reductase small subunit
MFKRVGGSGPFFREILKYTFGMDKKGFYHPDTGRPLWFGVVVGMALMGVLTGGYHYAGSARLCNTCHSMKHEYSEWQLSKHKQFACIECHMPDTFIVEKLVYKTRAGMNDLFHEVLRDYPTTIRLSVKAKNIMNGNCLRCHYSTIENTPMSRGGQNCLKCHRNLVHGQGLEKGGIRIE